MKRLARSLQLLFIAIICALLGFLLIRKLQTHPVAQAPAPPARPVRRAPPPAEKPAELDDDLAAASDASNDPTAIQAYGSCRPNELILRFPDEALFNSFLNAMAADGGKVSLVAELDRLLAMRVAYASEDDMRELLIAQHVTFFPSTAAPPDRGLPTLTSDSGAEPVGANLLNILGATGDRSRWGAGVRIGVMDSGVIAHPALKHFNRSIEVVEFPKDLTKINGHATAVASLIAGDVQEAAGIAPAADIISIKVATEDGRSDALFMATGILAAVDEHVDLLNISMGQSSDNPLLADAVGIAQDAGVVIVASSGNDGVSDAGYPADYPGVVSVGAVDGKGVHMGFSNFGKKLSLCAPGYAVNAAWPGGRYVSISGTSASTPLVTGAIAAVMSDGSGRRLSAADAAAAVLACADDAGIPGPDTEYGAGILDVGRVMRRNTPNILDAAVTDLRLVKDAAGVWQLQASVQNQGTAPIGNPWVEFTTPAGVQRVSLGWLAPGGSEVFSTPVYPGSWGAKSAQVTAVVQYANAQKDITPMNNRRRGTFPPPQ